MAKIPSKKTRNYQGVNTRSDFTLVNKFLGYRSREDKTKLPPGYLIYPSQNVLIDLTGRLKSRLGYTRYGAVNATAVAINSWFDWEEHKNGIINLRASLFSDATNSLQFDYNGTWTTIKTGLGTKIRFCNYWKGSESENVILFVDGSTNVYEWNGSTTTIDSITTNTIKKQGTSTWAGAGFYAAANKKIMIRGVEYTYTGGETTTTLTGVTPDPTAQGVNTPVAGDLTYQSVVTQASITGVSGTPTFDGISNINNAIYYGRNNNNVVYVSKVNDYTTVAQATPRVRGDGATLTLRSPWVAFVPQETTMYISGGKSQWFQVQTQMSVDNTSEAIAAVGLKTSPRQGVIVQEAITHDRNSVVLLTNETRLVTLGRVQNIYETPMMTDYSYSVAKDFDLYDWEDSSVKFHKSFIYVAVPKENKWLIFNQTDPNNMFWEAPQTGQFSGFMVDNDGSLYAHGYNVPETYKLFDGGSDNTHPIQSVAKFSYYDYNAHGLSDYFNEFWLEGYISPNTDLKVQYNLDLDGCATILSGIFKGTNGVVCTLKDVGSLGKAPLGKHGLGNKIVIDQPDDVPPYFAGIAVTPRVDFYKFSPQFESLGVDQDWQLITFGPLVTGSMYGNNALKFNLS